VLRKDYVFLPPEPQQLLRSCFNSFGKFPGHSTLMGMLKLPSKPAATARWLKPSAIDYSKVTPAQIAAAPCAPAEDQPDATAQFTDICNSLSNMSIRFALNTKLESSIGSNTGEDKP